MKSNYIIAHCVYTLIKAVEAITLLVIHHSTKITIAVNFTFIFSWFTLKSKAFSLLALAGGWSVKTLQGLQNPTAPTAVGSMWGDYHVPTLVPSGETSPSWGLQCCPEMGSKPAGLNFPWQCPFSSLILDPWAPVLLDVWNQISSNASTPLLFWCAWRRGG